MCEKISCLKVVVTGEKIYYVSVLGCALQIMVCRADLRGCGAQLETISVGPGSQSTCTKVCRIGRGAQLEAIGTIVLRLALMVWKLLK